MTTSQNQSDEDTVLFDQWENKWVDGDQPTCQQYDPNRKTTDGQYIPRYLEYTRAERAELEAINNGEPQG